MPEGVPARPDAGTIFELMKTAGRQVPAMTEEEIRTGNQREHTKWHIVLLLHKDELGDFIQAVGRAR